MKEKKEPVKSQFDPSKAKPEANMFGLPLQNKPATDLFGASKEESKKSPLKPKEDEKKVVKSNLFETVKHGDKPSLFGEAQKT